MHQARRLEEPRRGHRRSTRQWCRCRLGVRGLRRWPVRSGLPRSGRRLLRRRATWLRRLVKLVVASLAVFCVLMVEVCASLRWVVPPTTMFMRNDLCLATYPYVALSDIRPQVVAATIVHADAEQAEQVDRRVIAHPPSRSGFGRRSTARSCR